MQFAQLKRREFIALVGGAAAWPSEARAQQRAVPVIGMLAVASPEANLNRLRAFREGLSALGYTEGQNVAIKYLWADAHTGRLPELATQLVREGVAVLIGAGGTASALAAKAATETVPIVFGIAADPVATGLVASLSRPGGNVTGVTSLNIEVMPKRLQLLHELLPSATVNAVRFTVLVNPSSRNAEALTRDAQAASLIIGRQVEILAASTPRQIDAAFASAAQKRSDALVVSPEPLLDNRRVQLVTLAAHQRLPAIYAFRENVEIGGLMSYGSNAGERDRQVGLYAGRILKGEPPANLPVMRAPKFEFVFNLQTARALGLEVPATLLAQADEVIE